MLYARPKAASQFRRTRLIVAVAPRSTCSHCGSANWLDHRVLESASTALAAGKDAFSVEEAAAGRPREISVSAAEAGNATAMNAAAASAIPDPMAAHRSVRMSYSWPLG